MRSSILEIWRPCWRRRHRGSFEDDDDGYEDKTGTWLDDSRRLLSWVFEFGSEYGMDGKGVEANEVEGRRWLEQAKLQGVQQAISRLEALEIS